MHGSISGVTNSIIWGGGAILIYSCSVLLILLKSIVFKVCEQEYMNIGPLNYRVCYATGFNSCFYQVNPGIFNVPLSPIKFT